MKERTQTILFRITEDTDTHVGMMNIWHCSLKVILRVQAQLLNPITTSLNL